MGAFTAEKRAKADNRKATEKMKLEINVPVSGLDLASLLEGEQGLFLSQKEAKTTSRLRSLVTRLPLARCQLAKRLRNRRQV